MFSINKLEVYHISTSVNLSDLKMCYCFVPNDKSAQWCHCKTKSCLLKLHLWVICCIQNNLPISVGAFRILVFEIWHTSTLLLSSTFYVLAIKKSNNHEESIQIKQTAMLYKTTSLNVICWGQHKQCGVSRNNQVDNTKHLSYHAFHMQLNNDDQKSLNTVIWLPSHRQLLTINTLWSRTKR